MILATSSVQNAWTTFSTGPIWPILHPVLMTVMAVIFILELIKFGFDVIKGNHKPHIVRVALMAMITMFAITPDLTFIPLVSGLETIVTDIINGLGGIVGGGSSSSGGGSSAVPSSWSGHADYLNYGLRLVLR